MCQPIFRIMLGITKALMAIEAARKGIMALPTDVDMLASSRETARLVATHYSTQIEGNRLTQAEVHEVLGGACFPGRGRDETEVRNYYRAIEDVERLAQQPGALEEVDIRRIHGLVMGGRATPTPYRDGQNVIRDSGSGRIVHMPPEAADVSGLMADLTALIADVRAQATKAAGRGAKDQSAALRRLDPRQRRLWEYLRHQGAASSGDIAAHLGLSPRKTVELCRTWIAQGFLALHGPSRKNRSYRLGETFEPDAEWALSPHARRPSRHP